MNALPYAQTRKEETRKRIVETASRLFQEKGVDGVGVDEIMRESGLTHGGFYAHFASKEALVVDACLCALDQSAEQWRGLAGRLYDDEAFEAFIERYLDGDPMTDSPACPMAMLGPEIARREVVQAACTDRLTRLIDIIARELNCERGKAVMTLSAMVGATSLAASVSDDRELATEILASTRQELLKSLGKAKC